MNYGYKEICPTDEQLALLYSSPHINQFYSVTNEYILLKDSDGEVLDIQKWDGTSYGRLKYSKIENSTFVLILIYIDRVCDLNKIQLNYYNIHK